LNEEHFYSLFAKKLQESVERLPQRNKPEQWARRSHLNEWRPFDENLEPDAKAFGHRSHLISTLQLLAYSERRVDV